MPILKIKKAKTVLLSSYALKMKELDLLHLHFCDCLSYRKYLFKALILNILRLKLDSHNKPHKTKARQDLIIQAIRVNFLINNYF